MEPTARTWTEQVERDGLVLDLHRTAPAGEAAREPVLLLHGFPQSARSWRAVADRLAAAGVPTAAPDQRGYSPGARPAEVAAYALPELAADVLASRPLDRGFANGFRWSRQNASNTSANVAS